ncbi:hypothetical protein DMENIID0001_156050 [Sergentomyia squamirostris]
MNEVIKVKVEQEEQCFLLSEIKVEDVEIREDDSNCMGTISDEQNNQWKTMITGKRKSSDDSFLKVECSSAVETSKRIKIELNENAVIQENQHISASPELSACSVSDEEDSKICEPIVSNDQ